MSLSANHAFRCGKSVQSNSIFQTWKTVSKLPQATANLQLSSLNKPYHGFLKPAEEFCHKSPLWHVPSHLRTTVSCRLQPKTGLLQWISMRPLLHDTLLQLSKSNLQGRASNWSHISIHGTHLVHNVYRLQPNSKYNIHWYLLMISLCNVKWCHM